MEKRSDIKVGFECCNNCKFCVVAQKRHFRAMKTNRIKKHLEESKKSGSVGVVFTGGEPLIRKDIFELISYAKELGFETIQVQTNGRMLCYKDFVKKLIENGVNEFGPSIHGHTAELHDYLTQSHGSFKQTLKGIKNVKELGQLVVTNTVITTPNFKFLPNIAEMLIKLKVDQFQFAFVHPTGNAWEHFDEIVPYMSEVKPFIHKSLEISKSFGYIPPKVMVEAYPLCFMQGYEKHCSEFYIPPTEIRGPGEFDPDFERTRREKGKIKGEVCNKCKLNNICEGPWKEYPAKRGWNEFKPIDK